MNTKFSFALLMIVIAIIATACAPAIVNGSALIDPVQPADSELVAPAPVTSNPAAELMRQEAEPRLQSGEISQSDNNNPDVQLNNQTDIQQNLQNECMSEDSLPRPYGGCTE